MENVKHLVLSWCCKEKLKEISCEKVNPRRRAEGVLVKEKFFVVELVTSSKRSVF